MNAVKYLRENARMRAEYALCICKGCPIRPFLYKGHNFLWLLRLHWSARSAAKKHPVETRQSRFLKEFPNVSRTKEGTIGICPQCVDTGMECGEAGCKECKQKYWSEEIHDE